MNYLKNRTFAAIALVLVMSIATFSFATKVSAADTVQTYAYIAVSPNPAAVGQAVAVTPFLSNVQISAGGTGIGARFHAFTVTITKPDGTTDTRTIATADPVSSGYFSYVPTTVGNYTFVFKYPGEFTPATSTPSGSSPDTTFLASTSAPLTLVVQQTALPILSGNPSPSSYWTRPVNDQNYGWHSVANNWLMPAWDSLARQFDQGSCYVPYASAPNSPHILWTTPLTFGGLVGGEYGATQYTDGRSYEQFFKPPVVISGRLYYNIIGAEEPVTQINYSSIVCVDMKDGSTLFTIPNATLSFGQIYNYVSPNQAGALAYLWETRSQPINGIPPAYATWRMFDAWTGQYMLSIANVPPGTVLLDNTFYAKSQAGPGDILVYYLNATAKTLTLWNSSKTIPTLANNALGQSFGTNAWQWRPVNVLGATLNAIGNSTYWQFSTGNYVTVNTDGRQFVADISASMPAGFGVFVGGIAQTPSIKQVGYDNTVYISNASTPGLAYGYPYVSTWVGYSMTDGSLMWGPTTIDITSRVPKNATMLMPASVAAARVIGPNDIFPMWCKETMQYYAWNVRTGQFLWGPTKDLLSTVSAFGVYNWESKLLTPDGVLYDNGYDGMVHAYNLTTGASLWDFSTGNAGQNTPYGVWPTYNGLTVADGKLFVQTSDHGNGVTPLYQGEGLYVLNYLTGQQLWNFTGWFEQGVITDGMYVAHNCYDNLIYAFGKGPSAVTVSVSPKVAASGSALMIEGTVADISPGAQKLVKDGKFNFVPAVSDSDQNVWMAYLYEQQQIPAKVNGVQVHLTGVDPNGNSQDLGSVTTDMSGYFQKMWTPTMEGAWKIVASFGGSNSYWPSYAQTGAGVTKAPSAAVATPTPPAPSATPPPQSPSPTPSLAPTPVTPGGQPSISALTIAIVAVVVIIIVVAAALVLLRRRTHA